MVDATCPRDFWIESSLTLFSGFRRHRVDGNECAAVALGLELHVAIDFREDRMINAKPDIAARMPLGAALTAQNIARDDTFTTELLDA